MRRTGCHVSNSNVEWKVDLSTRTSAVAEEFIFSIRAIARVLAARLLTRSYRQENRIRRSTALAINPEDLSGALPSAIYFMAIYLIPVRTHLASPHLASPHLGYRREIRTSPV